MSHDEDPPIKIPAVDDLHAQGVEIVEKTREYRITTAEDHEAAGAFLRRIARFKDDVVERFRLAKDLAHKAHRAICEAEKNELAPALAAEARIRRAMGDYALEEDRKRKIEQARLQAEQRERDEAARLKQAEELDRAGDTESAVSLLETPIAPVAIAVEAPKNPEGISYRDLWKWELVDPDQVGAPYRSPDPKLIEVAVKGLHDRAAKVVGGIRVWVEKIPIARK